MGEKQIKLSDFHLGTDSFLLAKHASGKLSTLQKKHTHTHTCTIHTLEVRVTRIYKVVWGP